MPLQPTRGNYLYCEVLKVAFADQIVTTDEARILHILALALDVDPAEAATCRDIVTGVEPSPFHKKGEFKGHRTGDVATYQSALIAALDDEVINEDEWALLDALRMFMNLQSDQHALIAQAIMMTAEVDQHGQRRLERLQKFLALHPYR